MHPEPHRAEPASDPSLRRAPLRVSPGPGRRRRLLVALVACGSWTLGACDRDPGAHRVSGGTATDLAAASREAMLQRLRGLEIDERVVQAMGRVPREEFVDPSQRARAYSEVVLPIEQGQSMYSPERVARVAELLGLSGDEVVLEIGTGSGYFTAVLSELAREIWSIEILPELRDRAAERLRSLQAQGALDHAARAHLLVGDGARGWPDAAPFNAIFLSVASNEVPQALLEQLAPGGRLVAPVGKIVQRLQVITRSEDGESFRTEEVGFVRFDERLRRSTP